MPKESKSLRLNRDTLSKMAQQIKEKLNNGGGVGSGIEVSEGSDTDDEPLAVLASKTKRRRATPKQDRSTFATRMADKLQQRMQAAEPDPVPNVVLDIDIDGDESRVREPFASADTCVDSSVVTLVSPVPMTAVFETERLMYSNRRRRASSISEDDDDDHKRKAGRRSSPT